MLKAKVENWEEPISESDGEQCCCIGRTRRGSRWSCQIRPKAEKIVDILSVQRQYMSVLFVLKTGMPSGRLIVENES